MGSAVRVLGPLALALSLGGLLGCPVGSLRRERSALEEGLARVDDMFARRADRAALDQAVELLGSLSLDAEDPGILARQARCDYALAYGYPGGEPAPSALHLRGREVAWRCLIRDPAFAGMLTTTGGRLTPAAVQRIGSEQGSCLAGLVTNWARWLALEDPAANGIDLEPLGLLARRWVDLAEPELRGAAMGAEALVASLTPQPLGPDLEEAASLFQRAIETSPDDLTLQVDLAERVYLPLDDLPRFHETLRAVERSDPHDDGLWKLENRRARARAHELLSTRTRTPDLQR